jgi:hypothetical protein
MTSITHWVRLEPDLGDPDAPAVSVEARIQDPAWLLARQWQLGELVGFDGGTPILTRGSVESSPLGRMVPRPLAPGELATGTPLPAGGVIEAVVECEPVRATGAGGRRLALDASAQLATLLADAGLSALRGHLVADFPLAGPDDDLRTHDPAGARRLGLLAGRVVDGRALRAALTPGGDPATLAARWSPPLTAGQTAALRQTLGDWAAWYDAWITEPTGATAWQPDWLDYGFSLGAPAGLGRELTIAAPAYRGELTWDAFDLVPRATTGAQGASVTTAFGDVLPTPVSFPGMPVNRFWQLEDEEVSIGKVVAADGGLVRAMLLEFVLVNGNDWFLVPVALPAGALHRVSSVEVADTFGVRFTPPAVVRTSGARRGFALWRLSTPEAEGDPLLFLPPIAGGRLDSEPIERVAWVRDELANRFWAVEERIEGIAGPIDRSARSAAGDAPPVPPSDGDPLPLYRAVSPLAVGYYPLFPDGAQPPRLAPGVVLDARDPHARGVLLAGAAPVAAALVEDTEVARELQWGRGGDGRYQLWVGRSVGPATTPASPGLAFDVIE